jgi:hypothetical protein
MPNASSPYLMPITPKGEDLPTAHPLGSARRSMRAFNDMYSNAATAMSSSSTSTRLVRVA